MESVITQVHPNPEVQALLFPSYIVGAIDLVRQAAIDIRNIDCSDEARSEVLAAISRTQQVLIEFLHDRGMIAADSLEDYGSSVARIEQHALNITHQPLMMIAAFIANSPRRRLN